MPCPARLNHTWERAEGSSETAPRPGSWGVIMNSGPLLCMPGRQRPWKHGQEAGAMSRKKNHTGGGGGPLQLREKWEAKAGCPGGGVP